LIPLGALYAAAEAQGLEIYRFPMRRSAAVSTPDGCIGIDTDKLETSAAEKVCLAHEMGHCLTGSFYRVDTPLALRGRAEERADRWAIRRLVPLRELRAALRGGCTRPDELAERFGVPEEFLFKAVRYYREARNLL